MNLFVLVLFNLILTVRSETTSADQKNADSSTLEKFLNPLHHDTNSRYGADQYLSNDDILRKLAGLSYRGGNNGMEFSRADNKLFLGNGGEYTVENALNLGLQYNNIYGYLKPQDIQRNIDEDSYKANRVEYGRNLDWLQNVARLYNLPNEGYNLRDDLLRYSMQYNDAYRQEYGRNQGRLNYLYNELLQNIRLEPDHIGYVGLLPKGYKGYNNFALIGAHQLGFGKRTYYGLRSPIIIGDRPGTPGILDLAGRRNVKGSRRHGQYLH